MFTAAWRVLEDVPGVGGELGVLGAEALQVALHELERGVLVELGALLRVGEVRAAGPGGGDEETGGVALAPSRAADDQVWRIDHVGEVFAEALGLEDAER